MARRPSGSNPSLFDAPDSEPPSTPPPGGVPDAVALHEAAQSRYLNYALSVITSRALPDVRDGLKPVQRRILYSMWQKSLTADAKHRKCATVVGDVMGNYHPHGDLSLYEALVRLAQPFSLRYPLIDGSGNFGSLDGDGAAAMRYTECRLARIADEMLGEIEQRTVHFRPNYDGTKTEPVVLPARVPNLLINGTTGIAVGMATNVPPHNLGEVCTALLRLLDNPDLTVSAISGGIAAAGLKFAHSFELFLERATIQYDAGTYGDSWVVNRPLTLITSDGQVTTPNPGGDTEWCAAFTDEIQTAVDGLKGGKEPRILSGQLALDALRICLAEAESIASESVVSL